MGKSFLSSQTRMRWAVVLSSSLVVGMVGCEPPPEPASFEPNRVFAYKLTKQNELESDKGEDLMRQPLEDAQTLLIEWFGTPDQPKLPKDLTEGDAADLISLERLKMAAGPAPASKEPSDHGLYRQLCVTCHGETGNGRGTTAASQNPYPRDFRMGVFKFKSTPRNAKPTRADLHRTLTKGLAGSQMPLFDKLNQKQLDALIDYVIYLSIRGEFERELLKIAANDLDLAPGEGKKPDRLYDPKSDKAKEQLETASEKLSAIAAAWGRAEDQVQEFAPPADVVVDGITEKIDSKQLAESVEKGKALFVGAVATCSKCHGESGKGDGKQPPDYDDWTKDFANAQWGIAPNDMDALIPVMAIGAMKPQPILPRNLADGKFRGGFEPVDIYRRIRYGIAGSPMPAAALANAPGEAGLTEADIWHLVNFVRSLSKVEPVATN